MIKQIVPMIFLLFSHFTYAQNDGRIAHGYSSADDAYLAVNRWVSNRFNDSNNRVVFSDSTDGRISLKGRFEVIYNWMGTTRDGGYVVFDFSIEVDKKVAIYKVSNIIHKVDGTVAHKSGGHISEEKPDKGSKIFAKTWRNYQSQSDVYIKELIDELRLNLKAQ